MTRDGRESAFECDGCGYPLTDLVRGRVEAVRCPECGITHGYPPPRALRGWPNPLRIAAAMCGPCAVFVAVFVVAAGISVLRLYLVVMWGVLAFAWVLCVFAPPVLHATDVARRSVLRSHRSTAAFLLAGAGIAANAVISGIGVWLALVL
jgi:hypothetical protein